MAPAITTDVVGTLVAVTSSEYSFKDESRGGEQRSGTSYRAWLSTAFDSTPVEVTLPPTSDWPKVLTEYKAPVLCHMKLETIARSKPGGRAVIEYRLVDFAERELPARGTTKAA